MFALVGLVCPAKAGIHGGASVNQRILVIDFEPRALNALKELLESAGYQVRTAGSGQDIAAALRQWTPALVVVEPMIPGQDGFKLCQGLKRGNFGPAPKIVVASRIYRGARFRAMAVEAGADVFLERPQNDPLLLPSIKKLLPSTLAPAEKQEAEPAPLPLAVRSGSLEPGRADALPPVSGACSPTPPPPPTAPPSPAISFPASVPSGGLGGPEKVFERISDGDIEAALSRVLGPATDNQPIALGPGSAEPTAPATPSPPVRVYASQGVKPGPIQPPVAPAQSAGPPQIPEDFFGSDPSLDSILDRVFPMAPAPDPLPGASPVAETPVQASSPAPATPAPTSLTGMFDLDHTFNGRPAVLGEDSGPGCDFELVTVHEESKAQTQGQLKAASPPAPVEAATAAPGRAREEWHPSDAALGTEPEDGGPPPSGPVSEAISAEPHKAAAPEDFETALDNVFARITGTLPPEALAQLSGGAVTGQGTSAPASAPREVPENLRGMDAGTADLLSSLEELENSIPEGAQTSDIRGDSVWTGSTGFEATGLSRELEPSTPLAPPPGPEDERTLEEVFAKLLEDEPAPHDAAAAFEKREVGASTEQEETPLPPQELETSGTGKKRPFWANWFGLSLIAGLAVVGAVYRLWPTGSAEPPRPVKEVAVTGAERAASQKPSALQGLPPARVVQTAKKNPGPVKTRKVSDIKADPVFPDRPRPVPAADRERGPSPLPAPADPPADGEGIRPVPETASLTTGPAAPMIGPQFARTNELDTPLRLLSGDLPQVSGENPEKGRVVLNLLIGTDGAVQEARIVFDPGGGLGTLALQAARTWRFSGPVRGGQPVRVWKTEVIDLGVERKERGAEEPAPQGKSEKTE